MAFYVLTMLERDRQLSFDFANEKDKSSPEDGDLIISWLGMLKEQNGWKWVNFPRLCLLGL